MGTRLGTLTASVLLVLAALVSATFEGAVWDAPVVAERAPEEPGDVAEEPPVRGEEPRDVTRPDRPATDRSTTIEAGVLVGVLLLSLAALGIALVVVAGLRLVRRRAGLVGGAGERSGPAPVPRAVDDESPEAALARGLRAALDDLAEGRARNAVVAIWLRLEGLARSAHFAFRPSDTPTEFARRACATLRLDEDAMLRLARLYREARFSTHSLGAEQRREARHCLERLLADLTEGVR